MTETLAVLGLAAVAGWAWGRRRMEAPPLPSLGEYEPTLRILPRGAMQRGGRAPLMAEHDGERRR